MYPDPFVVHFLSLVSARQGCRVLDAGSGSGRNAVYFTQQGLKVSALDASAQMVRRTRAAAPSGAATTLQGDIAALPFASDSFDLVVCTSVLEYLDAPQAGASVHELLRVLRPRGFLLLVTVAAEGSDAAVGRPPLDARRTTQRQLETWLESAKVVELLHQALVYPATAAVRAQWAAIAQRKSVS